MILKNNKISVGIDIGTHTTRVVVLSYDKENKDPRIVATGQSETEGMRLGYIVNVDRVLNSLKKAIKQAEDTLGSKIKYAYVSIGGISLSSNLSSGSVIISKADQEITNLDIQKVLADSEENLEITNRKIIHTIPLVYRLDGKEIYGRPEGMKGVKLEVKTLFISCLKQNIEDLMTVFALAKIEVLDVIASPIATSNILLGNKQKTAGCALVDIGSETVSIACFENNLPISVQVFSIGSMDITKDVALGFKIGLEEAESLKLGSVIGGDYPKKKLDEIIDARLSDIFELVDNHLKRLRRNELLPAGVVITGGGAHINKIEEIAKSQLKLPAKIGPTDETINNRFKVRDINWYTALGLSLNQIDNNQNNNYLIKDNVKQARDFFKSLLSQLLP
jgi:cell division protein FtsA